MFVDNLFITQNVSDVKSNNRALGKRRHSQTTLIREEAYLNSDYPYLVPQQRREETVCKR